MANEEVTAQKGALVGDEAVQAQVHDVTPEVNEDSVKAQVAPRRDSDPTKVSAKVVSVELDRVITDPSSPEAVQVPDAGRGFLDLPIHALDGPTVESVFADAGEDDSEEEAPAAS